MTITTISPLDAAVRPGQNGWPAQGEWRYADYLHLPDDGRRYEIIEGVLYVANAQRYGVAEYWLVEPKLRGVEVYILSDGEYALLGQYTGTELIESQVLAGLQLKANDLFAPAP